MLRNALWFYKKPRDCTARVKRKLILLSLCVSLLLLRERGRRTYSSLAYFALHIRIKHFKYFRTQPVQAQAALSIQHPTGTEDATLGEQHTRVTSNTQQSTCPVAIPGTPQPLKLPPVPARTQPLTEGEAAPCQGISQPWEQSCLKTMLVTRRCTGVRLDEPCWGNISFQGSTSFRGKAIILKD